VRIIWLSLSALTFAACAQPLIKVDSPPCRCECAFQATAPEIGRGCHVQGDVLVCPLVRRTLEIEPAVPSEDPRCTAQPDGTTRCEVVEP
jgi:hypothetical protein